MLHARTPTRWCVRARGTRCKATSLRRRRGTSAASAGTPAYITDLVGLLVPRVAARLHPLRLARLERERRRERRLAVPLLLIELEQRSEVVLDVVDGSVDVTQLREAVSHRPDVEVVDL